MKRKFIKLGFVILGLAIFFGCNGVDKNKNNKTTMKNNSKKEVLKNEVENLNSIIEDGQVKLSWEISDRSGISKIQVLRRYLNDMNPDNIFKKVKNLPSKATGISIQESKLLEVEYKVKLIGKDGKRSKGKLIKVNVPHENVILDKVEDKKMYIYLPDSYGESKDKKYPVIYMLDGQNLFSDYAAPGEWEIDENFNELKNKGLATESIVVGFFHAEDKRYLEYMPYKVDGLGKNQVYGDKFAEFIVKKAIPYIEDNYRAIPDRKSRMIMGSSMGGIFSMYTILNHSDSFSRAGVVSPWFPSALIEDAKNKSKTNDIEIWIDAGTNESSRDNGNYAINTRKLVKGLLENGYEYGEDFYYYEVKDGSHSEMDWAKRVKYPLIMYLGSEDYDVKKVTLNYEEVEDDVEGDIDYYINPVADTENGFRYSLMNQCEYEVIKGDIEIDNFGKVTGDISGDFKIKVTYNDKSYTFEK